MSPAPKLSRQVRALIVARAVNQLGGFSLAFLTVLLTRDFGASLTAAGIVSAAFGLATIPSRLLGGRLADGWGRRRTIVAGLVGLAVAQVGLAAAPGLITATVCALLMGLAFELFEPPSQATIADAVPPAGRASAFELLTTAVAAGSLAAGLIADVVGRWSLRWLFVVDAGTGLACAAIVFVALAPDHLRIADEHTDQDGDQDRDQDSDQNADKHTDKRSGRLEIPVGGALRAGLEPGGLGGERAEIELGARISGQAHIELGAWADERGGIESGGLADERGGIELGARASERVENESAPPVGKPAAPEAASALSPWRDPALLLVTASGTVFALVAMLMLTALPLSLVAVGLNPANAGLIMAVATATLVVARPVLRDRIAKLSHTATFALGYVLMAAGFCGYALAHSLPALLGPTALYSLGNLLVLGRSFAVVSELAPVEASARYLAVYGLSWGVATLLAPLVGTGLIALSGAASLWGVSAAVCGVMAVGQPWVVRRISRIPDDLGVIHSTKPSAERYDAVSI